MGHATGSHTKFQHRYHIDWSPKYRYKVLQGEVRLRVLPDLRNAGLGARLRIDSRASGRLTGEIVWVRHGRMGVKFDGSIVPLLPGTRIISIQVEGGGHCHCLTNRGTASTK